MVHLVAAELIFRPCILEPRKDYFTKSAAHGKRYSYYRKSSRGHNTLTFNGVDEQPGWCTQDDTAVSSITTFNCSADPHALVNLTPAYARGFGPKPPMPATARVVRGFSVVQNFSRIIVRDEWTAAGADNVTWAMHFFGPSAKRYSSETTVKLSADRRTATLSSTAGTTITATIDAPPSAQFDVVTPVIRTGATDPTGAKAVGNLRKLTVVLDPKRAHGLTVSFAKPGTPPSPPLHPLSEWSTLGALRHEQRLKSDDTLPPQRHPSAPRGGNTRVGHAVISNTHMKNDDGQATLTGIPWPGPCPCAQARWCKPLSPQPAPRPEIVAYHGSTSNTGKTGQRANPAWSAAGVPPFNNGSMWRSFDWTKVTTIGLFAPLETDDDWELVCTAHQHNVRVLPWAGAVWGRPSPISVPYVTERNAEKGRDGHAIGEASGIFNDKPQLRQSAKESAAFVASAGLDGILLDAEALRNETIREGMVYWVSQLRAELDSSLPGALLTWTTGKDAAPWCKYRISLPQHLII